LIERNTIPKILRADYGTENSLLRGIQPFLRESHSDSLSGIKSFMYGKSTSNQRTERFWVMWEEAALIFIEIYSKT